MLLPSAVINDKTKIKHQLQVSYSVIILFSAIVTLGICLLLLNSLDHITYIFAQNKITVQTNRKRGGSVSGNIKLFNTANEDDI